jgi:hypothetical protein
MQLIATTKTNPRGLSVLAADGDKVRTSRRKKTGLVRKVRFCLYNEAVLFYAHTSVGIVKHEAFGFLRPQK